MEFVDDSLVLHKIFEQNTQGTHQRLLNAAQWREHHKQKKNSKLSTPRVLPEWGGRVCCPHQLLLCSEEGLCEMAELHRQGKKAQSGILSSSFNHSKERNSSLVLVKSTEMFCFPLCLPDVFHWQFSNTLDLHSPPLLWFGALEAFPGACYLGVEGIPEHTQGHGHRHAHAHVVPPCPKSSPRFAAWMTQ